jgi:epoxyqueuosine reductase
LVKIVEADSNGIMLNNNLLEFLKEEFTSSKLNMLPDAYGGGKIFATPLIGVAKANDPIFQKYKESLGTEHLNPLEMWLANDQNYVSTSELSVISIVFPFVDKIRKEGKNYLVLPRITLPAEIYTVARNYGNEFKRETVKNIIRFFEQKGFNATSGLLSDAYSIVMKKEFYTTWSERYIAFAAGLGTLGLHEGLITDVGCNIRLASVITNAPLMVTPRRSNEPYANCLYFAKGLCKECAKKCPVNAITDKGYNKIKCNKYRMKVARKAIPRYSSILKSESRRVNWKLNEDTYIVGCELCQFGVQCTDKNPMQSEFMDYF